MRSITVLAALLTSCLIAAGCQNTKGSKMSTEQFKYGFRYDPMKWVENSPSLEAALVRKNVFGKSRQGDQELVDKKIDSIFAHQGPEGYLGNADDRVTGTGSALLEAVIYGASLDRTEAKLAIEFILKHPEGDQGFGAMSPYAIEALCRLGRTSDSQLTDSIQRWLDIEEQWNHPDRLCPWTPAVVLRALWCARELADVTPAIERGLISIRDNLDENGRIGYNDPWGFVDCSGVIAHPIAREIIVKQMPLIIEAQHEDGGWGDHSFITFRALHKHGFLSSKTVR